MRLPLAGKRALQQRRVELRRGSALRRVQIQRRQQDRLRRWWKSGRLRREGTLEARRHRQLGPASDLAGRHVRIERGLL